LEALSVGLLTKSEIESEVELEVNTPLSPGALKRVEAKADALCERAIMLQSLGGGKDADEKTLQEVERLYKEALEVDQVHVGAMLRLGVLLIRMERLDTAEAYLDRAEKTCGIHHEGVERARRMIEARRGWAECEVHLSQVASFEIEKAKMDSSHRDKEREEREERRNRRQATGEINKTNRTKLKNETINYDPNIEGVWDTLTESGEGSKEGDSGFESLESDLRSLERGLQAELRLRRRQIEQAALLSKRAEAAASRGDAGGANTLFEKALSSDGGIELLQYARALVEKHNLAGVSGLRFWSHCQTLLSPVPPTASKSGPPLSQEEQKRNLEIALMTSSDDDDDEEPEEELDLVVANARPEAIMMALNAFAEPSPKPRSSRPLFTPLCDAILSHAALPPHPKEGESWVKPPAAAIEEAKEEEEDQDDEVVAGKPHEEEAILSGKQEGGILKQEATNNPEKQIKKESRFISPMRPMTPMTPKEAKNWCGARASPLATPIDRPVLSSP